MKVYSVTDVGQKRKVNQDYVFASEQAVGNLPNLFVVADGMGGHNAGDFASSFAVQVLLDTVKADAEYNPIKIIRKAIENANLKLLEQAAKNEGMSGMGTTCLLYTSSIENETAVYEKQPEESPTAYAGMIDKKMGCIQWEEKAKTIEQLIRGLNPWPSAYTYLQGKTLKIWEADVLSEESGKEPGEVVRTDKTGLYIQTGDKVLCVKELQLEGKKRMEAGAFLRGYEIPEGTRLKDSKE